MIIPSSSPVLTLLTVRTCGTSPSRSGEYLHKFIADSMTLAGASVDSRLDTAVDNLFRLVSSPMRST